MKVLLAPELSTLTDPISTSYKPAIRVEKLTATAVVTETHFYAGNRMLWPAQNIDVFSNK